MAVHLYHATHRRNLVGIVTEGISPVYATGKMKAVWLHSYSRVSWARAHVCTRHNWSEEDVVVLRLPAEVPVVRFGPVAGVWWTGQVIPASVLSVLHPGGGRPRPLIPWA